ncbi:MFS transporter [Demequina aurantiaca]|uniref:MFS transporter n=1 Tax=Demequina aurantiaca TaxID=676200 RepID=UPI0007832775|nr:MFS transporter [Demequina aurantiaca]
MSARAPSARVAWIVFAAGVFVYFTAVVHRTALGVAGVEAVDRFGIQATGLALFTVVQLGAYAMMQVPAGHLLDRFGPRAVMVAGSLVMASGQLLLAVTDHVSLALVARVLIGAGDAPIFIAAARLVAEWFPPRRVPILVQVTGLIGQAGQLATAVPVALLLHSRGWSATFSILAGFGVVAAMVAFFGVRMPLSAAESPVIAQREKFWRSVRAATTPAGTQLGFWSHFLAPFGSNSFALLWGVPFLVMAQDLTPAQASSLLVVLTVAAMIAGPAAGFFTSRFPMRRSWIVLGSATASAVAWAVLLSFNTPRPMWQLALFCVVIGVGGPISLVGIDFARTFSPAERLGTATGFVNIGGFLSTIVAVLLIGLVLQLTSPPGATEYTLNEFRLAFAALVIPWAVGLVGVIRSRKRTRAHMASTGVHVPRVRDTLRRQSRGQ